MGLEEFDGIGGEKIDIDEFKKKAHIDKKEEQKMYEKRKSRLGPISVGVGLTIFLIAGAIHGCLKTFNDIDKRGLERRHRHQLPYLEKNYNTNPVSCLPKFKQDYKI